MNDFRKLRNFFLGIIIYSGWIGLNYQFNSYFGLLDMDDNLFGKIYVVFSFFLQFVGGGFVVYYVSQFLHDKGYIK